MKYFVNPGQRIEGDGKVLKSGDEFESKNEKHIAELLELKVINAIDETKLNKPKQEIEQEPVEEILRKKKAGK